jgi:hypothetical protein
MEATMESTTSLDSLERTHAPVGFAGAFLHEFKLLWTSRRPLLLILAGIGLLAVAGQPWSSGTVGRLFFVWPIFAVIIGPVWAFAVLSNENPSNRLYHWSQPVTRHLHSLARILAGLAWLWIAYALVAGVAFALATADGNAWQLQALGGLAWLNLFTGPLIGYLAVSIFTLASDYPVRWFLGILFLFPVTLNLLSEWEGPRRVATALARVITDPDWGLGPALVGALGSAALTVTQLAVDGAASDGATSALFMEPRSWLLATLLWTGILGALVVVAAVVHPDRRPRLPIRRS